MRSDPIDRALSHEPAIEPAPEFAAAVMAAVHREVRLPPIAFPWRRFFIGLIASVGVPVFAAWIGEPAAPSPDVAGPLGWAASALLGSWGCYLIGKRLAVGPRD